MRSLSCGMQDYQPSLRHIGSSSQTRGWTWPPCTGSAESQPLGHQGGPTPLIFRALFWRARGQHSWSFSLSMLYLPQSCLPSPWGRQPLPWQPALSQVEKNSKGNIIFKESECAEWMLWKPNLRQKVLGSGLWLMWLHVLLTTRKLKTQPGCIFACHQRISNPLTILVLISDFTWVPL